MAKYYAYGTRIRQHLMIAVTVSNVATVLVFIVNALLCPYNFSELSEDMECVIFILFLFSERVFAVTAVYCLVY